MYSSFLSFPFNYSSSSLFTLSHYTPFFLILLIIIRSLVFMILWDKTKVPNIHSLLYTFHLLTSFGHLSTIPTQFNLNFDLFVYSILYDILSYCTAASLSIISSLFISLILSLLLTYSFIHSLLVGLVSMRNGPCTFPFRLNWFPLIENPLFLLFTIHTRSCVSAIIFPFFFFFFFGWCFFSSVNESFFLLVSKLTCFLL